MLRYDRWPIRTEARLHIRLAVMPVPVQYLGSMSAGSGEAPLFALRAVTQERGGSVVLQHIDDQLIAEGCP